MNGTRRASSRQPLGTTTSYETGARRDCGVCTGTLSVASGAQCHRAPVGAGASDGARNGAMEQRSKGAMKGRRGQGFTSCHQGDALEARSILGRDQRRKARSAPQRARSRRQGRRLISILGSPAPLGRRPTPAGAGAPDLPPPGAPQTWAPTPRDLAGLGWPYHRADVICACRG